MNSAEVKEAVLNTIKSRKTVRSYTNTTIDRKQIIELIEAAQRSPSGYNLQPWYFILVDDPEIKHKLRFVCFGQRQVEEASAVVVFVADPDAWKTTYPSVLEQSVAAKFMSAEHAAFYQRNIKILFSRGIFGLLGIVKAVGIPLVRLFRPVPDLIYTRNEALAYVKNQTMLAAATFMIAAKGAGLDTSPMEGFDEYRLKRLLNIPQQMAVPIIIAIGIAEESEADNYSIRLPLTERMFINRFSANVLKKPQA